MIDVGRQSAGRVVPPHSLFFQGLHHDPVQLAPQHARELAVVHAAALRNRRKGLRVQRGYPMTRTRRFHFPDDPTHFIEVCSIDHVPIKGCGTGEQFVQHDSQRIDVAAGIHIKRIHFRLFGTHIQRRPNQLREVGVDRLLGSSSCLIALATPKSITFTTGLSSCNVTSTFEGLMSRWMIPF